MKPLKAFLQAQRHGSWPASKYPDWEDLEKGIYPHLSAFFSNWNELKQEPELSSVLKLSVRFLWEHNSCLLVAPAGRGKTVSALMIGHHLFSTFSPIYYVRGEEFEAEEVAAVLEAAEQGTFKPLVIVDDFHLNSAEITEFILPHADDFKTKFLLASRPTEFTKDLVGSMPKLQVQPDLHDATQILIWCMRNRHPAPVGPPVEAREIIQKIYGDREPPVNLGQLGRFFKALASSSAASALQVAESLDESLWDELDKELDNPVLLPVAALSSLELTPDETFISSLGTPQFKQDLIGKGILEKQVVRGSGNCYRINPSDAEDFLRTAQNRRWSRDQAVNEFVSSTVKRYLISGPSNLGTTLNALRENKLALLNEIVADQQFKPIWQAASRTRKIGDFAAAFPVLSSASPELGRTLYELWLGTFEAGNAAEKRAAAQLSLSSLMNAYCLLLGLRLAGLREEAREFSRLLNLDQYHKEVHSPGFRLNHLSLFLREYKGDSRLVERLLTPAADMAPVLRHSSVTQVKNIFGFLEKLGLRSLRKELVRGLGTSGLQGLAKKGATIPVYGWFLHWIKDVKEIRTDMVVDAMQVNSARKTLTLGGTGFLLRELKGIDGTQPLRRSLLPQPSDFNRLLSVSDASDIGSFADFGDARLFMDFLAKAAEDWHPILQRSSLSGIAWLENNLRKRAKVVFERHPGNLHHKSRAERFQDYSAGIIHALNTMDWATYPITRIKDYRRLLLNALSVDGIYKYRKQEGKQVPYSHSLSARQAAIIRQLDLKRALDLELEVCKLQAAKPEEAYEEWARFAWVCIRAGSEYSPLSDPRLRTTFLNAAGNEQLKLQTRSLLLGCAVASEFRPGAFKLDSNALLQMVGAIMTQLQLNASDPEANPIEEVFLVLLCLLGAVSQLREHSEASAIFTRLENILTQKFFDYFDSEQEQQVCKLLQRELNSISVT